MPGIKKTSAPKTSVSKNAPKNVKKKVVKKTSKTVQKEVVAPVVAPEVTAPEVTAPVEVTTTETAKAPVVDTVSNYGEEFTHLLGQLRSLQTTLKELTIYTTKLEKRVAKDQKAVQKRVNGKRKRATGNSSPSGFSKPGPVSDELRTFLKLGKDDLIARTDVTKRINAYCKEKGLQGKEDKRILLADKPLTKLLRIKKGDQLTFFNLQKYMKVHFPNKEGVYPTA
jgi:chromatin remodeling complex protein RSC6